MSASCTWQPAISGLAAGFPKRPAASVYWRSSSEVKILLPRGFGAVDGTKGLAVVNLNQPRLAAFVRRHQQVARGDPKALKQFRERLRKRSVIPDHEPGCNRSALVEVLGRYQKHLRSERGLLAVTILNYPCFVATKQEMLEPGPSIPVKNGDQGRKMPRNKGSQPTQVMEPIRDRHV